MRIVDVRLRAPTLTVGSGPDWDLRQWCGKADGPRPSRPDPLRPL